MRLPDDIMTLGAIYAAGEGLTLVLLMSKDAVIQSARRLIAWLLILYFTITETLDEVLAVIQI